MEPKKILFANAPFDGHFNPLTGLAVHLKNIGYDVRWYSQDIYGSKIKNLGIVHYPFKRVPQFNQHNFENFFEQRKSIKGQIKKLKFDIENVFILRAEEYLEDMMEIREEFEFDMLIADVAFTGIPLAKSKLEIPVIAIGIAPLAETSKDLAPAGLGITPSYSVFGKVKQSVMRWITDKFFFGNANKLFRSILRKHGIEAAPGNVFDILYRESTLVLQSGTPGFEYSRTDLGKNIRFIGPLLPHSTTLRKQFRLDERFQRYDRKVLVTQGTVEKDPEKIIVPTLEAFRGTNTLVIATTGGSRTTQLKAHFPDANFIIEDFIPFNHVMPLCDVYITNGGYGGVLLGIENKLPLVVAGVHEGKNEINARVGYFELGINLKTEAPKPGQIKEGVERVLADRKYKRNVQRLSEEFSAYDPNELCEKYVAELLKGEKLNSQAIVVQLQELSKAKFY